MYFIKMSLTLWTAPGSPQIWHILRMETLLTVILMYKLFMGGEIPSCLCFHFVEIRVWEEKKEKLG